jgi:hypothetical protein
MAKLDSPFPGGIKITQGYHGKFQNFKAMDLVPILGGPVDYEIYAPCDVEVKGKMIDASGNSYFRIFNYNWMIEFVHAYPVVKPGKYKKGTQIGHLEPPKGASTGWHTHTAIQIAGVWYPLLDFIRRDTKLVLSGAFKPNEQYWGQWSNYADRQLAIITIFPETPPAPQPIPIPPVVDWEIQYKELKVKYDEQSKALKQIFNISAPFNV